MTRILTINGGSSSIRFALFEMNGTLERLLDAKVEQIGTSDATLKLESAGRPPRSVKIEAGKPESAVEALGSQLEQEWPDTAIQGIRNA
jgi:acetate kinase